MTFQGYTRSKTPPMSNGFAATPGFIPDPSLNPFDTSRHFKTGSPVVTPDTFGFKTPASDSRHFDPSTIHSQTGTFISPPPPDRSQLPPSPFAASDPSTLLKESAPSPYELMPMNPKFWILPPKFKGTDPNNLPFPYKEIAMSRLPEVPNVKPIEDYSYFSIVLNEHTCSIVHDITSLHQTISSIPDATWFPSNNYQRANWYAVEGYKVIPGLHLDDLNWYITTFDIQIKGSKQKISPDDLAFNISTSPVPSAPPSQTPGITIPNPSAIPPKVSSAPRGPHQVPTGPQAPFPGHEPHSTFQSYAPPPGNFNNFFHHPSQGANFQHFNTPYPQVPYNSYPSTFYPQPNIHMVYPTSTWVQPAHPGYTNLLYKEKEINIPKWTGDVAGWHNFHTRLEVSLADLNKSYLLTKFATNPQNASDSKLLARALLNKLSGDALLPFSSQTELFLNKGIEMNRELRSIYAPVDGPTLFSLPKSLTSIKM